MIHLSYRFHEGRHWYSLTFDRPCELYNYWVWFYLGHKMKGNHKRELYPYRFTWGDGPSKVIKSWKDDHHAEKVADWIFKAMNKHRKNRK